MSFRANSLQAVAVDGVYFAALSAILAGAMSATVRGQDVRTARTEEVLTDRRLTDDHIDSQLNTDDNMPSGDPTESPAAKREANMLGMKLYEVRTGHIRVDDVAATSPAWDAGIRKGDQLISIDTLRPRSLAPWVQEVGRILKDTPDGKSVAAAVVREGETLSLRIRVPVSNAAEVRDARQEERAIANMAAGNQQMQLGQQGVMPVAGSEMGGSEVPYGGYGGMGGWGMGGFFDEEDPSGQSEGRMATNAVANLMSVNTLGLENNSPATFPQNGEQTQSTQPSAGTQPSGGQVGIAGFQNSGDGVRAAVVVRGLVPGIYQVGIGQGDLAGGVGSGGFGTGIGTGTGTVVGDGGFGDGTQGFNGRNSGNGQRTRGGRGLNDFEGGGAANPNQNQISPQGGTPFQRPGVQGSGTNQRPETPFFPQRPSPGGSSLPAGGTAPASGASGTGGGSATGGDAGGASLANPHGSPILAQQLDPPADPRMNSPAINNPSVPGAAPMQTGNPVGTGNTNQPFNGPTHNGANGNANNFPAGMNPTGGVGSPQFVMDIGVLRVGQDGSGRVENQLQGVQVQNLAGMSVMVVSQQAQAMPAGPGGINNANRNVPSRNTQPVAGAGMNGIVATGMIQVVEGRGNPGLENSTGQTGNEVQDNSGTEELRNRNRTGTPPDFDPRSPGQ